MNNLDQQWLIKDNMGWDKTSYRSGPISGNFSLSGIAHPNTNIANTANAIFVIYRDGQHYNSRDLNPIPPYFGSYVNLNPLSNIHKLASTYATTPGKEIDFLYLTNIYEGDDPPSLVSVSSGHQLSGPSPYSFDRTTPSALLTASHSIKKDKDITLIIDHSQLLAKMPNSTTFTVVLKDVWVVGIRNNQYYLNTSAPTPPTQPIFSFENFASGHSKAILSKRNCAVNANGDVTIDAGAGNFTYINIRPTQNLDLYFPDPNAGPYLINTDYAAYAAVFDVNGNNNGTQRFFEVLRLVN